MGLDVAVGAFNIGTATGNLDITSLSFQPKCVIFWWTGRTGATNGVGEGSTGSGTRIVPGYGFAVSTTASTGQRACSSSDLDGAADTDTDACHINGVVCSSSGGGAFTGKAELSSFLSNGFRLNRTDAFPTDMRVSFMALGGTDITDLAVHDVDEPASTGAVGYTLSPSFQPDFLLFIGTQVTTAADAAAIVDSSLMLGWAAGTGAADQGMILGSSDELSATMDTDSYGGSGSCLGMIVAAGGNLNALAALQSFDSSGFTLNWANRAVSNRRYHALAIKGPRFKAGELSMSNTLNADIVASGFGFQPKGAMFATVGNAEDTGTATRIGWLQSVGAVDAAGVESAQGFRCQTGTASSTVTSILRTDEVVALVDGSTTGAVQALVGLQTIDSGGFTLNQDDADSANGNWLGYWAIGPAPLTITLTESVGTADTEPRQSTKVLADAAALADTISKLTGRTLADSLVIADAVTKGTARILVDGVAVADTVSAVKITVKDLLDAVAIADTLARSTGRALVEVVAVVDDVAVSLARVLVDAATIADVVRKSTGRALVEAVAIADAMIRSVTRTAADSAVFVDDLLLRTGKTPAELVAIADSIRKAVTRAAGDVVAIDDDVRAAIARAVGESTTIADTVLAFKVTVTTRAETLAISDVVETELVEPEPQDGSGGAGSGFRGGILFGPGTSTPRILSVQAHARISITGAAAVSVELDDDVVAEEEILLIAAALSRVND